MASSWLCCLALIQLLDFVSAVSLVPSILQLLASCMGRCCSCKLYLFLVFSCSGVVPARLHQLDVCCLIINS
jgi:hypothetical protein